MIKFSNIHVGFNLGTAMETRALRGINISIKEGEFVTVIGSNGAGKSTLLKCLTGVATPQKGSILVDDTDITSWNTPRRAEFVAHVFQDPMMGTCADLSIEENLALAYRRGQTQAWKLRNSFKLALTHQRREQFRAQVSILGMGLENRLHDPIGLLSGGQRQTLSLIMAILSPMKVLVLDEHTAALDPKMAAMVMDLTRKIVADRQLTTMMVTHSMHQALEAGTRTIMLHQGKVVLDISGTERSSMNMQDLLELFKKKSGAEVDDDRLVLD
jgi:putative tryptophan/tyrosine transport system ATP-binding protein